MAFTWIYIYYFEDGEDWYSIIQDWQDANVTDGFPCDRSYVPATELERKEFLGLQVFMPKRTDDWLKAIYSDSYMTPIWNWNAENFKTRIIKTTDRSYRIVCEV